MSHERPPAKGKTVSVYSKAFKLLSLLEPEPSKPAFALGVDRLTGSCEAGRFFSVRTTRYRVDRIGPASFSFLPEMWILPFDECRDRWSGCDNWWAGYPIIAWVELRRAPDDYKWQLRLNGEIGPVCPADLRKALIVTIRRLASNEATDRIQFTSGATKADSLYSRFLKGGAVELERADDPGLIDRKIQDLLTDFELEFRVVGRSITQLFDIG